jgi:hypothetical protein
MDDARFDAWTRHLADPSRRQVVRAFGGLVGTTVGILAGPGASSAKSLHRCCVAQHMDGTIVSACFNNKKGETCPRHTLPPGFDQFCDVVVWRCSECNTTICTPRPA